MTTKTDSKQSFEVILPPEITCNYEDKNKELGSGGFAKVVLCEHIATKEKVAVKVMNKKELAKKDDLHRAYNEIYALKNLIHQSICQLFEVFETENFIYLIIEYCPHGELFDYIVSKKRLAEKEARYVFRQIIAAIAFIHKNGYAHRDLKPENMLLDNEKKIKLIDFGLSAKPEKGLSTLLRTRAGSALYASPELISGEPYYGNETDVWSLGVVLFALLCGFLPFDHESTSELYKKIKSGKFPTPLWLSPKSLKLLKSMLEVNPQKRINIKNILKHEWTNIGYEQPVQYESKQGSKLNVNVIRLLSEYKCCSYEQMEAKVQKLKYNQITAFYFLLCKMSDDKLQKFASTKCKQQVLVNEAFLNNLLVSSNKTRFNGYILEGTPIEKRRSNTYITNSSNKYSELSKKDNKINPKPRSSSVADIYSNNSLLFSNASKQPMVPPHLLRNRMRSQTVTSDDPEKIEEVVKAVNPRVIRLKDEDKKLKFKQPVQNLQQTKRLATSCMDSLDSMKSAIPATESHVKPDNNKSSSLPTARKPRTRSMKEFKQRLSGLFKHMDAPRRVKAIYHVENTSTLPPRDLKLEIERVLNTLVLADVLNSYSVPENYLFKCKAGADKKTVFELEICLIPYMDNVVGVRRKRLKGDAWKYKELVEQILTMAKF